MIFFGKKKKERNGNEPSELKPLSQENRMLSYQVSSVHMVGARSNQEDSCTFVNANDVTEIIKNGLLAVVADGMGGLGDGKKVSETVIAYVTSAIKNMDKNQNIPAQLKEIVLQTNKKIYSQFKGAGGSTLVLVYFYKEMAYWLSVGDSSIFLKRGDGLYRLNSEHNLLNQLYLEELQKKTINKKEAEGNPKHARLSEYMGASKIGKIDLSLRPLKLKLSDKFLLCSDGISGFIGEELILDALEHEPKEAAARLNNYVTQQNNPKQDNYTGLIVSVED